MKKANLKPISLKEMKEINGGWIEPVGITVGICASLLYAYEWGYNYAYKRTH